MISLYNLVELLFKSLLRYNWIELTNFDEYKLISEKIRGILILCENNNQDEHIDIFCKRLEKRLKSFQLFQDIGAYDNLYASDNADLSLTNNTSHSIDCGHPFSASNEKFLKHFKICRNYKNKDLNIFKIIYKIVFRITRKLKTNHKAEINQKIPKIKDKMFYKIIILAKRISYESTGDDDKLEKDKNIFGLYFEILDDFIRYEVSILVSYYLKIKNSIHQTPKLSIKWDNYRKNNLKISYHCKLTKANNIDKLEKLLLNSKMRYRNNLNDDKIYFTVFENIVNKSTAILKALEKIDHIINTNNTMVDLKTIIGFEEEIEIFNFYTMEPSMLTILRP